MNEVKIDVPKGYVINMYKSTASEIVFDRVIKELNADDYEVIREGGYLCKFWDEGQGASDYKTGILKEFTGADQVYPFKTLDSMYNRCEPLSRVGFKQPWFGGAMPIDEGTPVIIYYRNGVNEKRLARDDQAMHWDVKDEGRDIVAFIIL